MVSKDTYQPRRGRPRATPAETPVAAAPVVPPLAVETAPEAPAKRRRRASVGGHAMKLAASTRKGFTRRWFNDDGNRIADAHELGYDYVTEAGVQSSDPGSRISRLVGTKANGEPLRSYLMETPDELYAEGVAEKEAHNRKIDEAIVAGRDSTGHLPANAETYGQGSIRSDR